MGFGNPATDTSVKDYLQLQEHVTSKQATFFVQLATHLDSCLQSPTTTPTQRFLFAYDQAYFKATFLAAIDKAIWVKLRSRKFCVSKMTMAFYSSHLRKNFAQW